MSQRIDFQLVDSNTDEAITTAGGVVIVTDTGDLARLALQDVAGASVTQPRSLSNGRLTTYCADSINGVDLYIYSPTGHFVKLVNVTPGDRREVRVDKSQRACVMQIPFSADDITAATEFDTGVDEPTDAVFDGIGSSLKVVTVDATETVDVGTDSGDSGDADGFCSALSLASATTLQMDGALLLSTADFQPHVSTGKSITITTSAGTDTAEGLVNLAYWLNA